MVPAGGFTDNEHHVGIIQALRLNIGEFFAGLINDLLSEDSSTCAQAYSPSAESQFDGRYELAITPP
jgi:hypothetical protein